MIYTSAPLLETNISNRPKRLGQNKKIMKKTLVLMALGLGMFTAVNAQTEPQKGDVAVEVGFSPFRDNGETFKLNEGMFKFRYFLTDKDALRLKLELGMDNQTNKDTKFTDANDKTVNYKIENEKIENKDSYTKFSFAVGYERHFKTVKRLDVYAGAEVGYGLYKYSGESTRYEKVEKFNNRGILQETTVGTVNTKYVDRNSNGTSSSHYFKGSVFTGLDFYVYKGLYLGTELGIYFKSSKSPNTYSKISQETRTTNANGNLTYSYTSNYNGKTGITESTTFDNNHTVSKKYIGVAEKNETTTKSKKRHSKKWRQNSC